MTTITCDVCDAYTDPMTPLRVDVIDGEHHAGKSVRRLIDVCRYCAAKMDLSCEKSLSDIKKEVNRVR